MFKVAREFSKNFMVTFAKIRQKSRQFNSFFFCFFSKPDKVNSDQGVGKLKSILAGVRDRTFYILVGLPAGPFPSLPTVSNILGPHLFIIFIADLSPDVSPPNVSPPTQISIFADVSKVFSENFWL